jgi:hypothetical protein
MNFFVFHCYPDANGITRCGDRNCQLIKINAEFVEALKHRGMNEKEI